METGESLHSLLECSSRSTGKEEKTSCVDEAVSVEFLKTTGERKWLRCLARTEVRKNLSGGNQNKSNFPFPTTGVTQ